MRRDEELSEDEPTPAASGVRAFEREALIACARCVRANPPTRMRCLYCGATLPAAAGGEDLRRPTLRPLEEWERGFNIVLAPCADSADVHPRGDSLAEAAALVRLSPEQLREMCGAGVALPLARTAEREEAELLEHRLCGLGLKVEIVADEDLAVEERPPWRVRRMRFDENWLAGWSQAEGGESKVAWNEIRLVVVGRIFRKRIEVEERLRRGGGGAAAEAREFVEDEGVLDLYFAGGDDHWRVAAENFDYSCLGARKSLLAAENFALLAEELRARAQAARFDDSYRRVRHWLQFAWPPAEQTAAGGLRRAGLARYSKEAVTSVSNEAQFTRYGRLLNRLAGREKNDAA